MDVGPWQTQLRKGAAELVVLSALRAGELYGLEILERVNRAGGIVAEGALYPLLNRLANEGKILSHWVLDKGPHPRKYYGLTAEGTVLLAAMTDSWVTFRMAMATIVESAQ